MISGLEIELKYKIENDDDTIIDRLCEKYHATGRETIHMAAQYYDTKDLDFMKRKITLRRRKENNHFVANIKSKETYEKGLYVRHEWEKEIDPTEKIDFQNWFKNTEAESFLSDVLSKDNDLGVVLETIFIREKIEFSYKDSLLEAALDKGYILANGKRTVISEIEIELLRGKKEDIKDFGKNIIEKYYGLEPENLSKYARGLTLIYQEG